MKKLLIALVAVVITASSYGQGRVFFSTKVGADVDAPVTIQGTTDGPGTAWSAQLYLSQNGSLTALTPATTFRAPLAGAGAIANRYVVATPVDVPQIQPGNPGTFVVRAWLTSLGGYDAAFAAKQGGYGESAPVTINLGGGQLPDANLVGLQAFSVLPAVPEPSVIALGVLGAAALLLRRRK